jgi:hypothetical protein
VDGCKVSAEKIKQFPTSGQNTLREDRPMSDQARLVHTVAITEAINRYFAALDQKQLDETTMRQIFAADATVVRPNGTAMIGPKEIGESHRTSLSRFRATQHLTSGFIITLTESATAEFRANLVAMHL